METLFVRNNGDVHDSSKHYYHISAFIDVLQKSSITFSLYFLLKPASANLVVSYHMVLCGVSKARVR